MRRLAADPELDMIYTDEDVIAADERRIAAHLKPGWSPETFSSMMYTCHLGVYRRALAQELGGFRAEFDGTQDYDFVLRLIERTDRIAHIPRVLYHWRAHARSTAGAGDVAKPQAYLAQPRAIAEHLERTGVTAEVQFGTFLGMHRIVHEVEPSLTTSLVVAITGDPPSEPAIAEAARSWLAQPHPAWELSLAASPQTLQAITGALRAAGVERSRIVTVATDPAADPTIALDAAARAARGEHLLLMQSPVIGLTHDWLGRLLGYSAQPGIAAAGPIVLAPNGHIEAAGIAISEGIPLHLLYGREGAGGTPTVMNVIALSGVAATPRETFETLGGLRPEMGDLALIDYCLRAHQAQMRIVIVPDARVRSAGPDTTTNDLDKLWQLRQAWQAALPRDPYYNPHYRPDRGDFIPSAEP